MAESLPPVQGPHPDTPSIRAPRYARGRTQEPPTHELSGRDGWLESVGGRLPDLVREPLFWAVSKVNDFIFRSDPAGEPVQPTPGSWSFAALGDYGSGSRAQADVAASLLAQDPELVVTLGDNIYWNGAERNWQRKWDPPEYFGRIREQVPVLPALGNHDVQDTGPGAYFRRFPELEGARFYSYEKDNVNFTVLDSNESLAPGSRQYQWLEQQLAGADQDDWKVMYLHHPMYSQYTARDGVLKDALGPLTARYGVDLVLSGHDHNYERTKPLNEHGTIHALVGAGGHTLYPFLVPQAEWSAYRTPKYGHLNVEVTDDRLVGRYILRDGSVHDTFVIDRSARQAVQQAAAGVAATSTSPSGTSVAPPVADAGTAGTDQ